MSNLTLEQKNLRKGVEKGLNVMRNEIQNALPKHLAPEKFSQIVITAATLNPDLLECDKTSLFSAILTAAQLGLEPNSNGSCYLIPYNKNVQFQIGYRGMIELARRSGELISLHAEVVYENDDFDLELGINPTIKHTPKFTGPRGKPTLVYSVAKLKDGGNDFQWMSVEEIEQARKANKGKSPAWNAWWSEMAKKVVMKRHLKTLPMSTEVSRAINNDESVKNSISNITDELDIDVDVSDTLATQEDKAEFYEWAKNGGFSQHLNQEERTEIQGNITKDSLDALRETLKKKASGTTNTEDTKNNIDFD